MRLTLRLKKTYVIETLYIFRYTLLLFLILS
jgi:hypothetical protein